MNFPQFQNDEEMGTWFEENDVNAADLEEADVTVAPGMTVRVVGDLSMYCFMVPGSAGATAAPTVEGVRDLTPVG